MAQTDIVVARQYADPDMFVEWYFILKDGKMISFSDGDEGDVVDGSIWAFNQIPGVVVRQCEVAGINMEECLACTGEEQSLKIQVALDEALQVGIWDE